MASVGTKRRGFFWHPVCVVGFSVDERKNAPDESSDDVYMMSLQMSLLMSLQMGSFLFEDLQGQLETYTTLLSLQMMSTRHVPRTSAHNQKSQLYRTSASMQTCARRRGKKGQQNLTIACVRVCVHFHKSSAP